MDSRCSSSSGSFSSIESTISTNRLEKKKDPNGPLSLNELISERKWERAIALVKVRSRFARKKITVPSFLNEWKGKAEVYPIHQAASSTSVPVELIDVLLFAYPEAIHKKESVMNRNCLHIALRAGAPEEVINYFIERYPHLAVEQDDSSRIPLHYACSNFASIATIRKLINICPQSICAPDKKGWTPLHVAVSKCTDPQVTRLMVSVCPDAVVKMTSAGSTPMMVTNLCPNINTEIFRSILDEVECELSRTPSVENFRFRAVKTTEIQDSLV
jgi:ankyrin repeat protein